MSTALPLALTCTLFAGCTTCGNFCVNGTSLPEQHREILSAPSLPTDGLALEIGAGDVRIEASKDGACQIELVLHEVTQGDASARFENGKLVITTKSGKDAAIGDVIVRTNAALAQLAIGTGAGDVRLEGVDVLGALTIESGAGDVNVRGGQAKGKVELESGAGDMELSGLVCDELEISTGAGDVHLDGVHAKNANLDSGVGDIRLQQCELTTIEADTGVGDVHLIDCKYEKHELDSGLGDVEVKG